MPVRDRQEPPGKANTSCCFIISYSFFFLDKCCFTISEAQLQVLNVPQLGGSTSKYTAPY
jgi:hypothetical protein